MCIRDSPYGDEGTVKDVLTNKIATIGENMSIRRFEKVTGETVVSYIHGGRIGAVVAGNVEATDDVKAACLLYTSTYFIRV